MLPSASMRDINLKAMEYFEAVARLGRVSKAALEPRCLALGGQPADPAGRGAVRGQAFRREKQRLVLTLDGDRLYHTTSPAPCPGPPSAGWKAPQGSSQPVLQAP